MNHTGLFHDIIARTEDLLAGTPRRGRRRASRLKLSGDGFGDPGYIELLAWMAMYMGIIERSGKTYRKGPHHADAYKMAIRHDTRAMLDCWCKIREWSEFDYISELRLGTSAIRALREPAEYRKSIIDIFGSMKPGVLAPAIFARKVHAAAADFLRDMTADMDIRNHHGVRIDSPEHWMEVEGRLIHYMLSMPLRWLGLVKMGKYKGIDRLMVVRKGIPRRENTSRRMLVVQPNFEIHVVGEIPEALSVSLVKFADEIEPGKYSVYMLNRLSVLRGIEFGVQPEEMLDILSRYSRMELPQNVIQALSYWSRNYGRVEILSGLAVVMPGEEAAESLLRKRAVKRMIQRRLSPVTFLIKSNDKEAFSCAAQEAGIIVRIART